MQTMQCWYSAKSCVSCHRSLTAAISLCTRRSHTITWRGEHGSRRCRSAREAGRAAESWVSNNLRQRSQTANIEQVCEVGLNLGSLSLGATACKLARSMALLLACCVSPCAGLGHANNEALAGRFHDFFRQVMSLQRAGKYQRPAWRPPQG